MTGEVKGEAKSPSKIIKLSAATKEISVGMLVIAPGFAPEETTVTKVNSETEIEVAAAYSHTESGEIEFETGFCHFP
jgi:hypothetical protein